MDASFWVPGPLVSSPHSRLPVYVDAMKVLVADDDPISRRLVEASLSRAGYEPVAVGDGAEALRRLAEPDSPRLVVLDWVMPGMDGLQVCRAIRAGNQEQYIYVLLLTSKDQQWEIVEGLDAGADDYVTKPFDLHELRARLRSGARILQLQDELVAARERLRIEATHDSLTGLLNRAATLDTLEKEVARSARDHVSLTVIMSDLDHFKNINDTYGHAAGDTVLREAARRMRASVRTYDSIGRYGGEEFLVVAPGCGKAVAAELAERLRACVCETDIAWANGAVTATVSLGVASRSHEAGAEALLRAADEALYRAKVDGRNRVVVDPASNE
jgi:two-component system cell cycle response regulator